ncbi:hypothetical protein [Halorubellus salinus]|uniref:hypothetical protein n=1 Tax=Halorubellus salinus TaxID=755309 RepID=UPI001D071D47|nr:hypothetical protein [Halorubellus salinus]
MELFESDADAERVCAAVSPATGSLNPPAWLRCSHTIPTNAPSTQSHQSSPLSRKREQLLALDFLIANLHADQAKGFVEAVADGAAKSETAATIAKDALAN